MITIFSPMRDFEGLIGEVQLSAIESWLNIDSNIEIFLFEDESKTIHEFITPNRNLKIVTEFDSSLSGVPLLDSMYQIINNISKYDIICYITADILLPENFAKEIFQFIHNGDKLFTRFVGVSCRYDLTDPTLHRNPDEPIVDYYKRCSEHTKIRKRSGIDLWVTKKDDNIQYLPFPIGRCLTDNWFVAYCKENQITIVDLSECFQLIHQNHNKPSAKSRFFEIEKYICHLLFENGSMRGGDLYDSDYLYKDNSFNKPKGMRSIWLFLYKVKLYRFILSLYRKMRIKYYRVN